MSGESHASARREPLAKAQLQRSPGSMSGESSSRGSRMAAPEQAGFNGAPARCPGRGSGSGGRRPRRWCFNGAPARCPGRAVGPPAAHDAAACFNGAPARCPGRGRGHVRALLNQDATASTEPRLDVRGEQRPSVPDDAPTMLQRSPGSMSGERLHPRSGSRGATCFNGAPSSMTGRERQGAGARGRVRVGASTEPRLDVRGEPPLGRCVRGGLPLQRSPGSMSGERMRSASLSPGFVLRFNGAPDGCPGRACPTIVVEPGRAALLQRSPGSMSGESYVAGCGRGPGHHRFNGAPARCPGRSSRRVGNGRQRKVSASTEPRLDVRGERVRR